MDLLVIRYPPSIEGHKGVIKTTVGGRKFVTKFTQLPLLILIQWTTVVIIPNKKLK